jgi:hypothetical protein
MIVRALVLLGLLVLAAGAVLYVAGRGWFVGPEHAGHPKARAISLAVVAERTARSEEAAREVGVGRPKQILFGDLHVHTTFSFDAFQQSLPMAGGDGAHPVADACDFARHCAALDFWSINDHAMSLTPRRWVETVDSIRQCNAVAGGAVDPDLVTYLGWEWTQVGTTPANHYGHKNVILRDLEEGQIPTRPISSGMPPGMPPIQEWTPSPFALGLLAFLEMGEGGPQLARFLAEMGEVLVCPSGVPVRKLPLDCLEIAPTPEQLFKKLDEWDHEVLVIPHGTTWGFYTPAGSSWDKQLSAAQHDPDRQGIVEVFSGHGNSEEFRPFRAAIVNADGTRSCPEPTEDYLPSCWRAGEIIEARCTTAGEAAEECARRAASARQNYVDAFFNGGSVTVPGAQASDWQDAGQCRDCFQPAFNYRPRSSVQYMMALGREGTGGDPLRFRFGFIASSDNHSARPGTGYKEVARSEFTEARFGRFLDTPMGRRDEREPRAESEPLEFRPGMAPFEVFETERQASFFLNGGLAAVHAEGRSREAIWDAFERKEVFGTSGPRILLWRSHGKRARAGRESDLPGARGGVLRARTWLPNRRDGGPLERATGPAVPGRVLQPLGSPPSDYPHRGGSHSAPDDGKRLRNGVDRRSLEGAPLPARFGRLPGGLQRRGLHRIRARRRLLRASDRGGEPCSRSQSAGM